MHVCKFTKQSLVHFNIPFSSFFFKVQNEERVFKKSGLDLKVTNGKYVKCFNQKMSQNTSCFHILLTFLLLTLDWDWSWAGVECYFVLFNWSIFNKCIHANPYLYCVRSNAYSDSKRKYPIAFFRYVFYITVAAFLSHNTILLQVPVL